MRNDFCLAKYDDEFTYHPLVSSILECDSIEKFEKLLLFYLYSDDKDEKIDINNSYIDSDKTYKTLLEFALKFNVELVGLLINNYNISPNSFDGEPLLNIYCKSKNLKNLKILIDNNVNVNDYDIITKSTPLHYACSENGSMEIVKLLLSSKKINLEVKNHKGKTPFLLACEKDNTEIITLLLSYNVDVNTTDDRNFNALHICCFNSCIETIKLLVTKTKINCNALNDLRNTPLHISASIGCLKSLFLLMKYGNAIPTIRNLERRMPLDIAISCENNVFADSIQIYEVNKDYYIEINKDDVCSICTEDFNQSTHCLYLDKCDHHYHSECYLEWEKTNRSCPMCRKKDYTVYCSFFKFIENSEIIENSNNKRKIEKIENNNENQNYKKICKNKLIEIIDD